MQKDPIVIVSACRTPIGNLLGILKDFSAHQLGTFVIQSLLERTQLNKQLIDEVLMGCVLPAGLGQAPARQAALNAGLSAHTPCTTVNKVCGSSMKTVMIAHDGIIAGSNDIYIAGGMESMTNAPYLLLKARQGYRLGHNEIFDHMMLDGLEDAYDAHKPMGYFAEQCAKQYGFTREQQDDYAIASFERAREASRSGVFAKEIVPIIHHTKQGDVIIDTDEHPFSVNPERIPTLAPVFMKEGTVTAGNSSAIADGAAGVLLMRASLAKKHHLQPLAKIIAYASAAKNPAEFTTAPIDATRKLLEKINWSVNDVDLFELNEAFAVVPLAFMQDLHVPHEKINIHGGACALGHPIGASGVRIIVTLLNALSQYDLQRGIATLCIGGGEATAIAFERI